MKALNYRGEKKEEEEDRRKAQRRRGLWASEMEILDRSCACAGITLYCLAHMGLQCLYTFTYRGKLRGLFNLPEDPCNDFCVHCFCVSCAICQEYRELKNRGLDPSLGWSGNEQQMNKATEMTQVPPNVAQGMAR
ncbi:hypothetical protein K1719_000319 [Acacia pycnantha]|nr:hypothetical protein K1719_000319 [Acacia pycnantha]